MKRRDFLVGSAGTMLFTNIWSTFATQKNEKYEIPRRKYKDDVVLSVIGFGGMVVVGMEQSQANRMVEISIKDAGINYFDVAPTYGDREAEIKLGKALKFSRKEIFLACKTMNRSAKMAETELHDSLKRLHTDYFDLYQLHAVTSLEDVEKIFAPSGALKTFIKAREQGVIRYIGFSAHSEEAALALLEKFQFDSILFPINFVCFAQGNFGPEVIRKAKEKNAAILALKMFAYSPWPEGVEKNYPKCWYQPVDDRHLARTALRFTLSEDITASIPPGDEKLFTMALELASDFNPLSGKERIELLDSTKNVTPLFSS